MAEHFLDYYEEWTADHFLNTDYNAEPQIENYILDTPLNVVAFPYLETGNSVTTDSGAGDRFFTLIEDAEVTVTGGMKVWNGSAWVIKPVKRWNGSAWVTARVKFYNGTSWELMP
ncbi:MAG TPA: hypothetical protein VIL74_20575 [Pyrinomonadaceae bacterium]|jgi:hypothetical protein